MYNVSFCVLEDKVSLHDQSQAWLVDIEPGRDTKSTFCAAVFSRDVFHLCPICSSMAALIWASKLKTLGDIPIFDSKTNGIRLVKLAQCLTGIFSRLLSCQLIGQFDHSQDDLNETNDYSLKALVFMIKTDRIIK